MNPEALIRFLKEIEPFKGCERVCRTSVAGRAESDAEHTWHLALLLLLLEEELEGIDLAKALKLALIHDLPELYAGDTNPYRDDTRDKEENELRAAERLFGSLPAPLSDRFTALFREYAEQASPEARIVKAADKLMPLIQNLCTNDHHSSYRKLGVEYPEVERYMAPFFDPLPAGEALRELYRLLLREARRQGVFAAPHTHRADGE